MSTARNPVPPVEIPSREEIVEALREHLEDADAEILAQRYLVADETRGHQFDLAEMKRRVLEHKLSR